AHGWRTAEAMKSELPWDSEREWRTAGGALHTLQGLVRVVPPSDGPRPPGEKQPFAEAIWQDSYEAEQHLLHMGRADEPVCWTLCGFASGYLSYCNGREIFCVEQKCVGRGDAVCHVIGKSVEEWGDLSGSFLPFYKTACLEKAL